MRLSAPKQVVWIVAVIVGLLGILGAFTQLPVATEYSFWMVTAGFVVLALATLLEGM